MQPGAHCDTTEELGTCRASTACLGCVIAAEIGVDRRLRRKGVDCARLPLEAFTSQPLPQAGYRPH